MSAAVVSINEKRLKAFADAMRVAGGTIQDAALAYARLGLRVVPVHGVVVNGAEFRCTCAKGEACSRPGKHPAIRGWKERACVEPTEVKRLFANHQGNLGIALGGEARLVVLDLDGPAGLATVQKWQREHDPLPATLTARSGRSDGGAHHFFRLPKGCEPASISNKVGIAPGVDVRAEGGMVVVPPSRHVTGRTYEWTNTVPPATAPKWLLQKLVSSEGSSHEGAGQSTGRLEQARDYLRALTPAISGYGGHRQTFEAALAMTRGYCLPREVALELMTRDYNPRCQPPWSDSDLARKVDEAITKGRLDWGYLIRADESRPTIRVRAQEHVMVDQAIEALARDPSVFQRGGALVRVGREDGGGLDAERAHSVRVARVTPPLMRDRLSAAADWTDGEKPVRVPQSVPQMVLARPTWAGIRQLEGVIDAPAFRRDGTVLDQPGYDDATRLLFEPSAVYPRIRENPSRKAARRSALDLFEVWQDFPFAGDADRSCALAALLTLFARPAISGPTPVFVVDGTTRGVGKGLLVDSIAVAATGRPVARMPQAQNDEEQRKAITGIALAAEPIVLIDNVTRPFGGSALDAATTATLWSDRLLGTNTLLTVPLRTIWLATGNNISFKGDMARRVLSIRLETDLETPETRTDFAHPDLLGWIKAQRSRLVSSALTILRAYALAGWPDVGIGTHGSFEEWSR